MVLQKTRNAPLTVKREVHRSFADSCFEISDNCTSQNEIRAFKSMSDMFGLVPSTRARSFCRKTTT